MSAELDAAIEHLYTTFAGYLLPPEPPACEHCRSLVDGAALAGRPLRSLPVEALEHVAQKVGTTWGGPDELRAVLPRLCELAAAGTVGVPVRMVTTKLRHGGWLAWPSAEQQAVADFLTALWETVLADAHGYHEAGTVLLAVAEAVDDLHPFLALWHQRAGDERGATRTPAVTHLARFVLGYQNEMRHGRLPDQLSRWLRGPTTHIQLDRATYDFSGTTLGDQARMSSAVLALAPP